ncbi:MAG TPA: hypothetical protein VNS79_08830 [Sphingobium sp.]|nr:hypothetical protein [Sphingobium sp.]
MQDAADPLKTRLRADIKAAMRARDADETRLLRALLAAIDNAQAVPLDQAMPSGRVGQTALELPRVPLSEADIHALLTGEMAERARAADAMAAHGAAHGHADRVARLRAEIATIRRYLAA